ncbi:MAG: hypothetical protein PVG14_18160 [Anaerolineales bacterium]
MPRRLQGHDGAVPLHGGKSLPPTPSRGAARRGYSVLLRGCFALLRDAELRAGAGASFEQELHAGMRVDIDLMA